LLLGDTLLITLIVLFILWLPYTISWETAWSMPHTLLIMGLLLTVTLLSLYILGMYDISRVQRIDTLLISLFIALGIVFLVHNTFAYLLSIVRPGRRFILIFISLSVVLLFFWRLFISKYFELDPKRILIIGNDEITTNLKELLKKEMSKYYAVVGHWHRHSHNPTFPNLASFVEKEQIDMIVYSSHSQVLNRLANTLCKLRFQQKNIHEASSFYQNLTGKFPIFFLDDFGVLINSEREFFFPRLQAKIKRVFDILFSLCCLPVGGPLILLSAILIKLESKGPVFFIQERLGHNEVPFKLIKLRTMVADAEKAGPQWCKDNDSRITAVGKFLRTFRLDELPQLINVLKGEMSLVGPRPLLKHFTDKLAEQIPYYRLRFLAKPGITGWAQICYGHANKVEDHMQMVQYDMYYIVHQSIWLDLFIIFKTIRVILWAQGSR